MSKTVLKNSVSAKAMSQKEIRSVVNVGPNIGQVSTVSYWYKHGHFSTEDEAKGAFKLAYQQGLDGMGVNIQEWMGLSASEYDDWVRFEGLPKV